MAPARRVLIVGGGLAGLAAARELRGRFRVTVVDAKEYFEFTSGIFRAYAEPGHWDSLTFPYKEILERTFGVGFIFGEVLAIDGDRREATVKTIFAVEEDIVPFDFCLIAGGCNFNSLSPIGESQWFPTIHGKHRLSSEVRHLDERFLEGRRRRILEEHQALAQLNHQQGTVLVNGAGFMGVEWACELKHFFPKLRVTVIDFLPRCLGPLPEDAARYCEEYMKNVGIKTVYKVKYNPNDSGFWSKIGMPKRANRTYNCAGVKQSNYFMPSNTLSDKGPGGGGWILINKHLQVITKSQDVWGGGTIFACGDCSVACVGERLKPSQSEARKGRSATEPASPTQENWEIPPMPKTGYPAEQQAVHASKNICAKDRELYGGSAWLCCIPLPGCCGRTQLRSTWYPWGAGIFAISLGPNDGCFIVGTNNHKNSGRLQHRGHFAAALKELIETTKIAHCRGDHYISAFLWYTIHHWPLNFVGSGPIISC